MPSFNGSLPCAAARPAKAPASPTPAPCSSARRATFFVIISVPSVSLPVGSLPIPARRGRLWRRLRLPPAAPGPPSDQPHGRLQRGGGNQLDQRPAAFGEHHA